MDRHRSTSPRGRRAVLTAALLAPLALAAACSSPGAERSVPRALVYRGPAGCPGCAETLAERLGAAPLGMDIMYIGPEEELPLTAESLRGADLFAQPGGGDDVAAAAAEMPDGFASALGQFVRDGGRYLGMCMGAYLAGPEGFGLLEDTVEGEVGAAGFPVTDSADHLVEVTWQDTVRWTYFQEGARLPEAGAESYARYENGDLAAALYELGAGRAALVGPHPEADASWLADAGLTDPDGDDWEFALPLIQHLLR
ncbi:biotin--protein ligase [Brachybacterium avium]|uniref:Biotin--protein ligase n=1 Tax=Brachybacterium avium TaxID=2017485 RepID=A0A220UCN2_9MICO|nr:BPL-N domain-containing protein [Brachybacterium avium]ASK65887.1 biotin--protein ligase [Brachybacterium avium]